jgi:transglutaminase-like putative cysteine protease
MRRIRTSLYYGEGWSEAQCGVAIHGLHVPSPMLLKLGYEIEFELPQPTSIVALLNVHPSRAGDLRAPDELQLAPATPADSFLDSFGNRCTRFLAPQGSITLSGSTLIADSGLRDPVQWDAREVPVHQLPHDVLRYLYNSRYCEVDRFSMIALELFGAVPPGWQRVQAVCDWVHTRVTFGYQYARPSKSALDVYTERFGVCRDFQHLAVTMCRALNIPARYVTGYLGDIGVPVSPDPMDFSAWFEAYLEDRWWTFDARHNVPRIGRVLMAAGRDASDVAITTSFGMANLKKFNVTTLEVPQENATSSGA